MPTLPDGTSERHDRGRHDAASWQWDGHLREFARLRNTTPRRRYDILAGIRCALLRSGQWVTRRSSPPTMQSRTIVCRTALVVSFLLAFPHASLAWNVRLAWQAAPQADGYRIYVRTAGGAYGAPRDVNAPSSDADGIVRHTLTGLSRRAARRTSG